MTPPAPASLKRYQSRVAPVLGKSMVKAHPWPGMSRTLMVPL